jgi:hypothetical protein
MVDVRARARDSSNPMIVKRPNDDDAEKMMQMKCRTGEKGSKPNESKVRDDDSESRYESKLEAQRR